MQLRASLCAAVAAAATLLIAVPTASSAALPAPKPVLPANNAPVRYLPAFQWTPVAGVDHYEFEIAADAGFNAPVTNDKDDHFDTWNTRATLKIAIPNGEYWWRVRGVRKNGAPSKWSPPRSSLVGHILGGGCSSPDRVPLPLIGAVAPNLCFLAM